MIPGGKGGASMTVPEPGFQRIAVLGLGKLGACLAATFAARGLM
jgi:UDP-N-acetyl-D-mannosaminuronate dehydrogenase